MTKFELNKTYRDGYGREVRIIATDAKHNSGPLIGLVTSNTGYELLEAYREDGTTYGHLKGNLIAPPVVTEKYLVVGVSGYKERPPVGIEPSQSCIHLIYHDGILNSVDIHTKNLRATVR